MATTRNKVMWQEGMLMRPHHFQQQQRYNDYLDNQRFRAMNDLSWGFTELTLNNELLAQGKIMIDSASGTLPDGTVFSIPDQDALPDPLHPQNVADILKLVKRIHAECPGKDIWVWTGYKLEELNAAQMEVVDLINVLVDGKFVQDLKDPALIWRGSSNQVVHHLR